MSGLKIQKSRLLHRMQTLHFSIVIYYVLVQTLTGTSWTNLKQKSSNKHRSDALYRERLQKQHPVNKNNIS